MHYLHVLLAIYGLALIVFGWICFAPTDRGAQAARRRPGRGRRRAG